MIDNHLTPEQIAQTADMQMSGTYQKLPKSVKRHLAECDLCASEVLDVIEIASTETAKPKTKPLRKLSIAISLAAAVLLFITFILFPLKEESKIINSDSQFKIAENDLQTKEKQNKDVKPEEKSGKSEKKNQPKKRKSHPKGTNTHTEQTQDAKVLYASYEPNPQLEALVERTRGHLRSSTISSFPLEIKYPEQRNLKIPIPSNYSMIVEIYTNKGELVSEKTLTDSLFTLPKLKDGLFYWKLINEDFDLLFVGKIKSGTPEK
ncbi:MAG: hypothetical protein R6U85_08825 [Salinivirgaceae bacterium]